MVDPVKQDDEQGLLGLAFHPDYAADGTFFVSYTSLDGNTQLDRMTVSSPWTTRSPMGQLRHAPRSTCTASGIRGASPYVGPDLLYIADVGENRREELNVVPRTAAGTNFGWDVLEGSYCRRTDCTVVMDTTVLPVMEYDHDVGSAIIERVRLQG